MPQYIVISDTLNKRNRVPAPLPDTAGIAGAVTKGYLFDGQEVAAADMPAGSTGKWCKGTDGFYYSFTGIALATGSVPTLQQVKGGTGAALATAKKLLPYIADTCRIYKIDTPVRQLCLFAQMGHESAGLFYTEELASGRAYEGRDDLGNTHAGDGIRYKGRGLIQITGRGNYKWLGTDLKIDLVSNPTLLGGKNADLCTPDQLKYAALSAGWYWNTRSLNAIADKIDLKLSIDERPNLDHFKLITKKTNGGYNGLSDRVARYKAGLPYFK